MRKQHSIFGAHVELDVPDGRECQRLIEELAPYPEPGAGDAPRVRVGFGPLPAERRAATPSLHGELEGGFFLLGSQADVAFQKADDELRVTLHLKPQPGRWGAKARNLQFTTRAEMLGQILHEQVLQPSLHFYPEHRAPVHAAAMATPGGNALLLGGTGGVGKTSLELELCMNRGCEFIADDISVLDDAGQVLPNLNLPKIYGYNLQDNEPLEQRIFRGRGLLDRVHFRYHARKGLGKVRRRVSPEALYARVARRPRPLTDYFLLVRSDESEPSIESLPTRMAVDLALDVLETEMPVFHRHLRWHRLNRVTRGQRPIVDLDDVRDAWRGLLARALGDCRRHLVRIPRTMSHRQFRTTVADQILERAGAA